MKEVVLKLLDILLEFVKAMKIPIMCIGFMFAFWLMIKLFNTETRQEFLNLFREGAQTAKELKK